MNEAIDQTHWLPKNTPIINAHRAAKQDIDGHVVDGRIVSVKVSDQTVARYLLDRDFIEDHHHAYGLCLLELLHATRAPHKIKTNSIYLDQFGGQTTISDAAAIYYEIKKLIGLKCIYMIESTYEQSAKSDYATRCREGIDSYIACFECLVTAMDDARDRIKEEKKTS